MASGRAGQREHGDVVVLAKVDGGLRGLFGSGIGCEQCSEAVETVKFTGMAASLKQAVGVESKLVAFDELETGLLKYGGRSEAEWQRAGKAQLKIVDEGRGVAGTRQGASAVAIDAQGNGGSKAALQAAAQAAIEAVVPGLNAQLATDRASNNQFVDLAHAVAWGTSAIALIVGILGIANTMAMSVFERTREIGILRAIGWKSWRVMLLIETEATALGFAGGILGIGAGWAGLHILSYLPKTNIFVSTSLTPVHLLQSMAISVICGIVAGVYPAWRGAHLSPVEALRHD